MSSLRHTVQRRNHKERSQPLARENLGILEKHKDYTLRAKDYGVKKQRLKILREKALERNPDEYHFGMMNSTTDAVGRRNKNRISQTLNNSSSKLYKTQDTGYLRVMAAKIHKDAEKLKRSILVSKALDSSQEQREDASIIEKDNRKVVFIDDEGIPPRPSNILDPNAWPSLSSKSLQQDTCSRVNHIDRRSKELDAKRLRKLSIGEREVDAAIDNLNSERARLGNSVGGVNSRGVKFKIRERKC